MTLDPKKPRRPKKARRRLTKIRVNELSLVDRHCVPDASFIIQKRLETSPSPEKPEMKTRNKLSEPLKKLHADFTSLNKRLERAELKLALVSLNRSLTSVNYRLDCIGKMF